MVEGLPGQPAPVRQRPMAAPVVDPAMTQEKREQLLPFAAHVVRSGFPGPDQIADGLMDEVWNPDPGQLSRPVQPRQRDGIPPVRLDPLA